MRARIYFIGAVLAIMGVVTPTAALAGQPVDGTTLTPPVLAGTPCMQDGRWVRCDTSNVTIYANEPGFDLPCGTIYETGVDDRHATRWYEDGLLVKRSVQASIRGYLSLSPTGEGTRVGASADWNWWIRYEIPGDESTGVLTSHGNASRVAGMRSLLRDTGIWLPDGTHHGLLTFTDEAIDGLCDLLAG
jgi:hypothetical protein